MTNITDTSVGLLNFTPVCSWALLLNYLWKVTSRMCLNIRFIYLSFHRFLSLATKLVLLVLFPFEKKKSWILYLENVWKMSCSELYLIFGAKNFLRRIPRSKTVISTTFGISFQGRDWFTLVYLSLRGYRMPGFQNLVLLQKLRL